jgi:hypothetical protein
MTKVIAEAAEVCASNAQMEWISAFRSKASAHGGHAIADGTNFFSKRTRQHMVAIRIAIFVTQNCRSTARRRAEVKDTRQAGARMRRHVAPARLLC